MSIALEQVRLVELALGRKGKFIVDRIVLDSWTIADYAERDGCSAHVAKGYLMSALDRLVDHLEPPGRASSRDASRKLTLT